MKILIGIIFFCEKTTSTLRAPIHRKTLPTLVSLQRALLVKQNKVIKGMPLYLVTLY